jgi:hypothetical protein
VLRGCRNFNGADDHRTAFNHDVKCYKWVTIPLTDTDV